MHKVQSRLAKGLVAGVDMFADLFSCVIVLL